MSGVAVNVAIIHEGKILLTQRDDFETWILPSGGVEDGESLAQAAIRETKEETGLDTVSATFLNVYTNPNRHPDQAISVAYAVKVTGELKAGDDAADAAWFAIDKLPTPLAFDHERIIREYLKSN